MKKILLLLFIFIIGVYEVRAYDISSSFYYDDEKVAGMWVTREKENIKMSGLPFFLKRKGDDKIVYCLEPFVMLKQETGYEGYYEINSYFNLTEEQMNRIRLLSYFGYMYPGYESDKWYGITQYLIWQTVEPKANIYFSETRYGTKVDRYQTEIEEIENLISDYQKLLSYNNQTYNFNNQELFRAFKKSNIFLKNIEVGSNVIEVPENSVINNQEIFYYHEVGQNLYLPSNNLKKEIIVNVTFNQNIILKKWYGSGKYQLEEGAVFEIYTDDELYQTVETNENGEVELNLEYGTYKFVQIKGKKGYHFVDDFILEINDDTSSFIELYNEAIKVEVPDTYKGNFITDIFMMIKWSFYDYKGY